MTAESPPAAVPPPVSVRRLLLLSIPALVIGIASAVALWIVEAVAGLLQNVLWSSAPSAFGLTGEEPWWIFTILTLTGVAVGLTIWLVPGHAGPDSATTELVVPPMRLATLPGLTLAVVLALAGGVSLGPENPIIAINTALAVAIVARMSKAVPPRLVAALAAAATIGALFGTPVAAALVFTGLAADLKTGGALWDRLFLPLVAAATGSITDHLLGGDFPVASLAPYGAPQPLDLLLGSLVACGAAVFGLAGVYLFPLVHRVFHRLGHPLLYVTLGGIVLGLLGMVGGPITLFKGLAQSETLLSDPDAYTPLQLAVILLVKLLALVVAASAGFRGGRIFPSVFIGVAAGILGHALLPALPLGLAVACGVLGLVLAIARDGWIALFVAVAIVGDVTVLSMLCVIVLPTWLIVTKARPMLIGPADLTRETGLAR